MSSPEDARASAYSLFAEPPGLKSRYRAIQVISHGRHVAALEDDGDTLIVSTDWLAWRETLRRGLPCLHFDSLLVPWPAPMGDPATFHQRACEWVYDEAGGDMTRFSGISLGKLFIRNVSLFTLHYGRAWHGLDRLLARFRPERLILRDLRLRLDLLDDPAKRDLLAGLAARHGVELIDRLDAPPPGDPGFPERFEGVAAPLREPLAKALLRDAYAWAVDRAFRLRHVFAKPRPVLMMLNWLSAGNLIERCPRPEATAALFASQLPKSLAFLADCWRRGLVLLALPNARLEARDKTALLEIERRLALAWKTPASDPIEMAKRDFVLRRIVAAGWLHSQALEVKRYQALFRKRRFARVVVGDATSVICRMIAEAAKQSGVPVDEMLNGQFVTTQRYDARTGDRFGQPCVDRLLSRGLRDEQWLEATGAPLAWKRIGYPALAGFKGGAPKLAATDKALVLPIYADGDDALAVQGCVFTHLAETLIALRDFGCRDIRVKLHVGPPNTPYYQALLDLIGVKAQIVKEGALAAHLEWADFVVGPVNSGALLEALAAGKPYFPFLPEPTLIDQQLIGGIDVLRRPGELTEALASGRLIDRDAILETLVSASTIADSPDAFWKAMADAA
jgi:hypothetical protein